MSTFHGLQAWWTEQREHIEERSEKKNWWDIHTWKLKTSLLIDENSISHEEIVFLFL